MYDLIIICLATNFENKVKIFIFFFDETYVIFEIFNFNQTRKK